MKVRFQKNLIKLSLISAFIIAPNQLRAEENKISVTPPPHLTLEKVVVLSRHGIRAPEEDETKESLDKFTPYPWADWDVDVGHLTKKGAELETYFGQYLKEYFTRAGLLNAQECADGKNILVYSNSVQRTIATSEALIAGTFPDCNVKLKHHEKIGKTDPAFSVEVRTDDKDFKKQILSSVDLEKINDKLEANYELLAKLINFNRSEECLENKDCEFFEDDGKLRIEKDKKPSIKASDMRTAKNLVNALMLEYYEGVPLSKIAANNIDTKEEWEKINEIKDEYFKALRGNPLVATHIALPLLNVIKQNLDNNNKITVLVGHDSNIVSVLSALGVKEYDLPEQYEQTPIGGKVMFEVWKDNKTQEHKLKTQYVYQSSEQLRQGEKLTLSSPPKHVVLEMEHCKADKYGLCSYQEFVAILDNIAKLPINAE